MLTRVPEEFLNVFRVASQREITFQLEDVKTAQSMRYKFNKIRARMRQEEHPDLAVAERVTFSIDGTVLKASPRAGDFLDEIARALEPHKELLNRAKLERELEDDQWLMEEAAKIMNKPRSGELPKEVKKYLKGKGD